MTDKERNARTGMVSIGSYRGRVNYRRCFFLQASQKILDNFPTRAKLKGTTDSTSPLSGTIKCRLELNKTDWRNFQLPERTEAFAGSLSVHDVTVRPGSVTLLSWPLANKRLLTGCVFSGGIASTPS